MSVSSYYDGVGEPGDGAPAEISALALQCVRSVPKERPSMVKACTTLQQIKASLPAVHGDRQA
jgi:hypothetical protein